MCGAFFFASNMEPEAIHNLICGAVVFASNIRAEDDT